MTSLPGKAMCVLPKGLSLSANPGAEMFDEGHPSYAERPRRSCQRQTPLCSRKATITVPKGQARVANLEHPNCCGKANPRVPTLAANILPTPATRTETVWA